MLYLNLSMPTGFLAFKQHSNLGSLITPLHNKEIKSSTLIPFYKVRTSQLHDAAFQPLKLYKTAIKLWESWKRSHFESTLDSNL